MSMGRLLLVATCIFGLLVLKVNSKSFGYKDDLFNDDSKPVNSNQIKKDSKELEDVGGELFEDNRKEEILEAIQSGTYHPKNKKGSDQIENDVELLDDFVNPELKSFDNDLNEELEELKPKPKESSPSFISELIKDEEKKKEIKESEIETDDEDEDHNTILDKIIKVNNKADLNYKEGDIVSDEKEDFIEKRNAIRNTNKYWKNGTVYYEFDIGLSKRHKDSIHEAFDEFHKHSCIKMKLYEPGTSSGTDRLKFFSGQGCWSFIGRSGGVQSISIGNGCFYKGIVMHEIMHALGFYHEQSRFDRDKYIKIMWENIPKGLQSNFWKKTEQEITTLGQPYDYDGLMHYGMYAFAIDRKKRTIIPLDPKITKLGQRNGFSKVDKIQLLSLYQCPDVQPGWSDWSPYSPCNDDCIRVRKKYCFHNNHTACIGYENSKNGVLSETKNCSSAECKLDGHWGLWSPWGTCSKTCGVGVHSRVRQCNNPAPRSGGLPCPGNSTETKSCPRGSCNLGPDDCTFEAGYCFWKSNSTRLKRIQYSTPSSGTGPSGDHTANGEGHYVYYEASFMNTKDKIAQSISKTFPASTRCMSFWYHMRGAAIGELRVVKITAGITSILFSAKGNKGSNWLSASVDITSSSSFQIGFWFFYGTGFQGDIAVDDVFFKQGACNPATATTQSSTQPPTTATTQSSTQPPTTATTQSSTQPPTTATTQSSTQPPTTTTTQSSTQPSSAGTTPTPTSPPIDMADYAHCSFNTFCNLKVAKGSWVLKKSSENDVDHTNEKGNYLESASNIQSRILTPVRRFNGKDRCLSFFVKKYDMITLDIGYESYGQTSFLFYENVGKKVNGWQQMIAEFSLSAGEVGQIFFEASGRLGLDDISITVGACPRPTPVALPSILTCGFEKNFCAWNQAVDDNFNWLRIKGRTPSRRTGPLRSLTGYQHYYIYIETSYPRRMDDTATLRSPVIKSTAPYCMSFSASLFGSNINELEVLAVTTRGTSNRLYQGRRRKTWRWSLVRIQLPVDVEYYVEIVGRRGNGFRGDIAVDEIKVFPGKCN